LELSLLAVLPVSAEHVCELGVLRDAREYQCDIRRDAVVPAETLVECRVCVRGLTVHDVVRGVEGYAE
jgi:hypothetical protein